MDSQVATFWAVMALLVLNVAAMVLFGRVLNRVKRLSEAIAAYVETIESDLRKTRNAAKDLIEALSGSWIDNARLRSAVARFEDRSDGDSQEANVRDS